MVQNWFGGDWERSAEQWNLPAFKTYLKSFNPELIVNLRLQGLATTRRRNRDFRLRGRKGRGNSARR
ncbi:hypothetical protein J27TS7_06530 [Paenibacillus dendritiformis]|nr:hypothetical protein J27TS7_06530 [Paenibacillus dendritiformis]